jgi:hypothetical protein
MDKLLEEHNTKDALGVLMTYSVFAAHLVYREETNDYKIDLSWLEQFTALPEYARIGGMATFEYDQAKKLMKTKTITWDGTDYEPDESDDNQANKDFLESKLTGWRAAEKKFIASLLSMTNLVLHVKDLHLELAAAFQAVTFDAFSDKPDHPLRRLLDPFIHRSVQATNDNFALLFQYKAAEFSLAPLPYEEQLRLIGTLTL